MTKSTATHGQDDDLDALFAAVRQMQPAPAPGLVARVIADADRVQAGFAVPARPAAGLRAWLAAVGGALGGGAAVAGIATAALAGFWIGIAQPDMLGAVGAPLRMAPDESVDLIPDLDEVLADAEG